jgi:hypothetical protein
VRLAFNQENTSKFSIPECHSTPSNVSFHLTTVSSPAINLSTLFKKERNGQFSFPHTVCFAYFTSFHPPDPSSLPTSDPAMQNASPVFPLLVTTHPFCDLQQNMPSQRNGMTHLLRILLCCMSCSDWCGCRWLWRNLGRVGRMILLGDHEALVIVFFKKKVKL